MKSKFGSDLFIDRHLGLGDNDERSMLNKLGFNNIDQFINQVIPEDIQLKDKSSEILQNDSIGDGWLVIVKPESNVSLDELMNSDEYKSKVVPN